MVSHQFMYLQLIDAFLESLGEKLKGKDGQKGEQR